MISQSNAWDMLKCFYICLRSSKKILTSYAHYRNELSYINRVISNFDTSSFSFIFLNREAVFSAYLLLILLLVYLSYIWRGRVIVGVLMFMFAVIKIYLSLGMPRVTFTPAPYPARWKVFRVIWVEGSPTDYAATVPTFSPGWIRLLKYL